jgi:hypothetical protein
MKFYNDKYALVFWNKLKSNKLSCIYCCNSFTAFFKNAKMHNIKNAAFITISGNKSYCLESKDYLCFNKKCWRKFIRTIKLQAFL